MINDAIEFTRKEIRDYLRVSDTDIIAGNIHVLKDNANQLGVYLSLINLEEECTLKNTSHYVRRNGNVEYQEPPVYLNAYLLCVSNFENYDMSLLRLSQTIKLFQGKHVFSSENQTATNPFPASLEKLIFDFYNLNFEQLNHLWGVLGGTYLPAVLYKVRMIKVQRDESIAGSEVTTIQVNTNLL